MNIRKSLAWFFVGLVCLSTCPQVEAEGYWRRTGKVEYDTADGRLPTQGVVEGKINGWRYKAEANDSTFQQTGSLKIGNSQCVVVIRGTWFARPTVIVPGVVIPCGGLAEVVEAPSKASGHSGGRCDVLCRLMTKKVVQGKEKFGLLAELICGSEITAVGYTSASAQGQNTKRALGAPGMDHKDLKFIYLSYHVSGGPPPVGAYQVFYEYAWNQGPLPAELEALVKKEQETIRTTVSESSKAGREQEPKITPINMDEIGAIPSGKWRIRSCGEIGSSDEKRVFYSGTIQFTSDGRKPGGTIDFGTPETLTDVSFERGVLRFSRTLPGVTQRYEGQRTAANRFEGTFTHKSQRFLWTADIPEAGLRGK